MKINNTLDIFSKNLIKLKNVVILILLLILIIFIIRSNSERKQLNNVTEKLTELNIKNELLLYSVKFRDSTILTKEIAITEFKLDLQKAKLKIKRLQNSNIEINKKYKTNLSLLKNISPDSSYSFLNNKAYPFTGKRIYAFNINQIKGIHKTYIKTETLTLLNANLSIQNEELLKIATTYEKIDTARIKEIELFKINQNNLVEIIDNKEKIETIKDKVNKKQKRKVFIQKLGLGVGLLLLGFIAGGA